ncbi:MAG TPA: efflux RND transporter periplasmic adaptor subunit [Prosthecochloris aestuarii]|uniref:Efflux RND transporter periplasmic adaptor subunit n=1 Tax=Prosthecochloris aestuarii TaxID=1102 RepID=A0A831SSD6_PROAE|nr:efflux RND transporter periplasmic adaptor subunit [Prosthecochloris aestuarii]
MNNRLIHNFFISCSLLLLTSVTGCSGREPDRPSDATQRVTQVSLLTPSVKTITRSFSYPAEIRARSSSMLSFRVDGLVEHIEKTPGEHVQKGELLMKLDQADYYDNLRVLQAELKGAQARADKALQDFRRAQELRNEDVISQADYDGAKSAHASAAAAVEHLGARVSLARHQLEYTRLYAPYHATVTGQMVEEHELVRAGQPVMSVHDISTLEVECHVPENDIARLKPARGMKALVTLPSFQKKVFEASLQEWSTSADKTLRTYAMRFSLPAPEHVTILPGMTAHINISAEQAEQHVLLPHRAITSDASGSPAVWLYEPSSGTITMRNISTGKMVDEKHIHVTAGLDGKEQIVEPNAHFFTEGMNVTPRETEPRGGER